MDHNSTNDHLCRIECSSNNTKHNNNNIFRDTWIRYAGYANEVGESFRYQYPRYVVPSYMVAFTYCLADSLYAGYQSYSNANHAQKIERDAPTTNISTTISKYENKDNVHRYHHVLYVTFDALLWQSLASVIIPGYTIHTIVKWTKYIIMISSSSLPILLQRHESTVRSSFSFLLNSTRLSSQRSSSSKLLRQHSNRLVSYRRRFFLLWMRRWIPTGIGLLSIPIIVHPIDHFVDAVLDHTTRTIVWPTSD
jgi:mitochondrial fission process protein 1